MSEITRIDEMIDSLEDVLLDLKRLHAEKTAPKTPDRFKACMSDFAKSLPGDKAKDYLQAVEITLYTFDGQPLVVFPQVLLPYKDGDLAMEGAVEAGVDYSGTAYKVRVTSLRNQAYFYEGAVSESGNGDMLLASTLLHAGSIQTLQSFTLSVP